MAQRPSRSASNYFRHGYGYGGGGAYGYGGDGGYNSVGYARLGHQRDLGYSDDKGYSSSGGVYDDGAGYEKKTYSKEYRDYGYQEHEDDFLDYDYDGFAGGYGYKIKDSDYQNISHDNRRPAYEDRYVKPHSSSYDLYNSDLPFYPRHTDLPSYDRFPEPSTSYDRPIDPPSYDRPDQHILRSNVEKLKRPAVSSPASSSSSTIHTPIYHAAPVINAPVWHAAPVFHGYANIRTKDFVVSNGGKGGSSSVVDLSGAGGSYRSADHRIGRSLDLDVDSTKRSDNGDYVELYGSAAPSSSDGYGHQLPSIGGGFGHHSTPNGGGFGHHSTSNGGGYGSIHSPVYDPSTGSFKVNSIGGKASSSSPFSLGSTLLGKYGTGSSTAHQHHQTVHAPTYHAAPVVNAPVYHAAPVFHANK